MRSVFKNSNLIQNLVNQISFEVGRLEGARKVYPSLPLRFANKMKTIQASLAIEANRLSVKEVTALANGKDPYVSVTWRKDVYEANNALEVYSNLSSLNPLEVSELLRVHGILMKYLVSEAGKFRNNGVGIFNGKDVIYKAPEKNKVPKLIEDLFHFINNDNTSWLLKACLFHYEYEIIHPFEDGNGRMGRLWQQLLMMKYHSVFEFIPVDVFIKSHQNEYYLAFRECDKVKEATPFVEFSLMRILEALKYYYKNTRSRNDVLCRLEEAEKYFGDRWFARKEYRALHDHIGPATSSRDLFYGVKEKFLINKGEHNQIKCKFIKKPVNKDKYS